MAIPNRYTQNHKLVNVNGEVQVQYELVTRHSRTDKYESNDGRRMEYDHQKWESTELVNSLDFSSFTAEEVMVFCTENSLCIPECIIARNDAQAEVAAEKAAIISAEEAEVARKAAMIQLEKSNWKSFWVINSDGSFAEGEGQNLDKYRRGIYLFAVDADQLVLTHEKHNSYGEHEFTVVSTPASITTEQLASVIAVEDELQARWSGTSRNGAGRRSPWIGKGFGLTNRDAFVCPDEIEEVKPTSSSKTFASSKKLEVESPFAALMALKK